MSTPRHVGCNFFQNPRRHFVNRRIFQALNLVQIGMIEHVDERLHRCADLSVVVNPAAGWIDISFHRNLNLEPVAMHRAALMTFWRTRQSLRRFEGEIFRQSRWHDGKDCTAGPILSFRAESRDL